MTIASSTRVRALEPVRSHLIGALPFVRHGMTFRVEGLGRADGNIGLGTPRDREDAWEMRRAWCEAIGVNPEQIVTMGQVHGNHVIRVTADDAGKGAKDPADHIGIGDALITNEPGVVLTTLHADCQPILLVDPVSKAIAAVHAGWRGTVADIAGTTVRAMQDAYGSEPSDLLAYLGPAIGPIQNEVGDEVIEAWLDQASDLGESAMGAVLKPGLKHHFDVPAANRMLLLRAGLLDKHIETSGICTRANLDTWFSHRGHGPNAGREGALIALVGE